MLANLIKLNTLDFTIRQSPAYWCVWFCRWHIIRL